MHAASRHIRHDYSAMDNGRRREMEKNIDGANVGSDEWELVIYLVLRDDKRSGMRNDEVEGKMIVSLEMVDGNDEAQMEKTMLIQTNAGAR
jgi:hypothetical protein